MNIFGMIILGLLVFGFVTCPIIILYLVFKLAKDMKFEEKTNE